VLEEHWLLATFTVTNVSDSGLGSLRQAILDANNNLFADTIAFNIPGSGVHTISPLTLLPVITDSVMIDGTTQPGYSGSPLIEIRGDQVPKPPGNNATNYGLSITADDCTVRGLVINRVFGDGIDISSSDNTIAGNYVGTDATGTMAEQNVANGIVIKNLNQVAGHNTIGGLTAVDRNIISGNYNPVLPTDGELAATGVAGIEIFYPPNLVPVDPDMSNVVEGNYVGTDVTGTKSIPNGKGILLSGSANTIGGSVPAARNIISGNIAAGIDFLAGGGGNRNLIEGNYIGTDVTGTQSLGNGMPGIDLHLYHGNTIGGLQPGAGNIIAHNGFTSGLPFAPAWPGIFVITGGDPQDLANNNAILSNSIYGNALRGIAFYGPWFPNAMPDTPGGPHVGPNNLQNYPVLTSAASGVGTVVSGTLNSTPSQSFTIQLFSDPMADPSGYGQGQAYLGSTVATTDSSGNAAFTVNLPATVPAGQVISATSTDASGNTSEFALSIPVTHSPVADLAVSASGPANSAVGQNLSYTVTVTNMGPDDATGVIVTDSLPAGAAYISATPSQGSVTRSGSTLTASLGLLAQGASAALTIMVIPPAPTTLTTAASATADQPDPDTANNSVSLNVPVQTQSDLSVAVAAAPTPILAGQPLTYTVTVSNAGPNPATGVTLTDVLPAGVAFDSASSSQGTATQANGTMTGNLGNLSVGSTATVTIVVRPAAAQSLFDQASVAGDQTDPVPANNSASLSTNVIPTADLSITASAAPNPVPVGANLTFTFTVTNQGPSQATGVVVANTLPAGVAYVSATTSQGTATQMNGTVTARLGTLAAGATATVTAVVSAPSQVVVTDQASVTADQADPVTANNTASATVTVALLADLGISIKLDPVTEGKPLTYILTVVNKGPNDAPGVVVTDPLPKALAFVSASVSQGTETQLNGAVTAQLGSLASGASATVVLVTLPRVIGTITNGAQVTGRVVDPVAGNNSATQTVSVDGPGIIEYPVNSPAGAGPRGITTGPDGALWFAQSDGNAIARISTSGTPTSFALPPFPGGRTPDAITTGPDGALWFTLDSVPAIGRMTTTGQVTEYPLAKTTVLGFTITVGPDGALWFPEATGKIGRITTSGQITEFPLPDPMTGSSALAAGPDHNLWFTDSVGNIDRITTSGHITAFPLPKGILGAGIAAGPDGALWFTTGQGVIGRITTAGNVTTFPIPSGAPAGEITLGPDHSLWFAEYANSALGRITPGGQVTEYPVHTPNSGLGNVTAGPDGNVWFTEFGASQVGKIVLPRRSQDLMSNDYDGDGKADLALFRPTTAQWVVLRSTAGAQLGQFGAQGDIPVPGDYDGDGKTDYAVYRPSTAQWFIMRSTAGPEVISFGEPNLDIPVPGDYDGDGKTDIAVFRPTTDQWFILRSSAGPEIVQFGAPGLDLPVPADYDGDGKTDLAVYRMSTAQWIILRSTSGAEIVPFGAPNLDILIPGDYDGDGKADLAVFRPSTAQWLILQSTGGPRAVQFGAPGLDLPVPADYDGDGKTDLAVYRPSTAQWILEQSTAGPAVVPFGTPNLDQPLELPLVYRTISILNRTHATSSRQQANGSTNYPVSSRAAARLSAAVLSSSSPDFVILASPDPADSVTNSRKRRDVILA
jgi:uncharacterized repeat protein (TIGR01451 family)